MKINKYPDGTSYFTIDTDLKHIQLLGNSDKSMDLYECWITSS